MRNGSTEVWGDILILDGDRPIALQALCGRTELKLNPIQVLFYLKVLALMHLKSERPQKDSAFFRTPQNVLKKASTLKKFNLRAIVQRAYCENTAKEMSTILQ